MCEIVNSPLFVKHSMYHQHIDTSNMKWSHRGYPADGQCTIIIILNNKNALSAAFTAVSLPLLLDSHFLCVSELINFSIHVSNDRKYVRSRRL